MAITTYSGIYTGPTQVFTVTKVDTAQSTPDNPLLTFALAGRPDNGGVGIGLSGSTKSSASPGSIPFKNAVAGQSTYLSSFLYNGSSLANGRSIYIIDLMWVTTSLGQVTTTQTINSITFPARDLDASTNGRGVYIAMWHVTQYSGNNAYTATITYTNSAGTAGRIGTVSRTGGLSNRWVPIGLDNGDEGVRSVQDFTFSALPGTSGSTVLIAYRPIVVMSSQYSNGDAPIYETAMSLGMPLIYDDSCLTIINSAYSSLNSNGVYTLSQG